VGRTPSLSVVTVAFNSREALVRTLPALAQQLDGDDELIVVDNASSDGSAEAVGALAPSALLLHQEVNLGFAAGANAGAAEAGGELLLFLNPDAMPLPGFCEAIRRPWNDARGWDAWMGLVTQEGGERINSSGNPVHFTGLTWAGGLGRPVADAPEPGEVTVASGACLAVPRETFRRLGGFPGQFFLYHEDVDLSMRLHLEGARVGIEPAALVDHDYEFGRSPEKMRWLERNRWAFLVRVYPAPLLLLLAPALLATEAALLAVALAQGWGGRKLRAWMEALRWLPRLLRERREVQGHRRVSSGQFAAWLTPELDSPYFGRLARWAPVRWGLRAYWLGVTFLLRGR
jgi:N-acetylglucosaminyl-diphospho-decaprenol L-rhamnosyltransferase